MPNFTPRFTLIEHGEHIEQAWPWPQHLPELQLVSTRFDHRALNEHDFAHYGIALPPHLTNAAHKRRAEFLAGRLCAQRALLRLTNQTSSSGINADRSPQWPLGCVGSITHSDSWAAAIVAKQTHYLGLGLDIEPSLSVADGQKLAPALLTPAELARLQGLTPEQFSFMVTASFSLKESLFKAIYPLVGRRFYFEDAELVEWDHTVGTARLRLLSDLDHQWPTGRELEACFALMDGDVISLVAVPNQPSSSHY